MSIRLPSRYEDLDFAFRGRLRPDRPLLELVKQSFKSMSISGGIRFLPIYGQSGSGKTSSSLELGTHLPDIKVAQLSRSAVESQEVLLNEIETLTQSNPEGFFIAVVDQYEEVAAEREEIPKRFVEYLSLLDRGSLRGKKVLFIWLTTTREFQSLLASATSRNQRILVSSDFEIKGPDSSEWPGIISETFQFHNQERDLSDYEILDSDLNSLKVNYKTIGAAIEAVGNSLAKYNQTVHDLSNYQIAMLWPVTDGLRITRIQQFTDPRQGYKLEWNAWYRQLNQDDQRQLPLREFNRARLYFDMRLVPIAAADLHPLCKELDNNSFRLHQTYLQRFKSTHFFPL